MATQTKPQAAPKAKRSFQFPSAVTTLAIVTLLVWIAALFIPSGAYKETPDGMNRAAIQTSSVTMTRVVTAEGNWNDRFAFGVGASCSLV